MIEKQEGDAGGVSEFLENYRAALLLALLEEKLLTRRQFERCREELRDSRKIT